MDKVSLLGVSITSNSKNELLKEMESYLQSNKPSRPLTIVTPNPEQIVYAQEDAQFRKILNEADIALPDGVGIELASSVKRKASRIKRIPGIEFMEDLLQLAAAKKYSVGFIGGRDGVAQKALEKIQQKYVGLVGWAQEGPEVTISNFKFQISNVSEEKYFNELTAQIKKTSTRMLFIGLGAPKQEYFLNNFKFQISNFKFTKPLVLMSVGGSFDELSGKIARPPQFISNLGLKWLWRLIQEPWRIKRQLSLVKFIKLVLSH